MYLHPQSPNPLGRLFKMPHKRTFLKMFGKLLNNPKMMGKQFSSPIEKWCILGVSNCKHGLVNW